MNIHRAEVVSVAGVIVGGLLLAAGFVTENVWLTALGFIVLPLAFVLGLRGSVASGEAPPAEKRDDEQGATMVSAERSPEHQEQSPADRQTPSSPGTARPSGDPGPPASLKEM